jgi:putative PIN family toxin of toxin-antitoxin system
MKSNGRYVFDTNVLISALLFKNSKPGQAFYLALEQGVILLSLPAVMELNEVLRRKKFERYLLEEERERFLAALITEAIMIEITEHINACSDPKDDMFVELAVSGGATCIISGDEHLLRLSPFRGIPIMKPDEFLISLSFLS